MADKIELEIVTPKGRALAETVDEVTAPSVQGEFGVLPGHLPVVTAIRPGIVMYKQGSEFKKVAVGSGFAEAGQNKLLILAEDFAERASVDPVVIRKELAEIQPKIEKVLAAESTPEVESEKKSLIDQENWLAAQLELYGDTPPATMRPFEQWGPPTPPLVEEEDVGAQPTDAIPGSP
jgi:F-type H+-transporting ATPase subunit epsilon